MRAVHDRHQALILDNRYDVLRALCVLRRIGNLHHRHILFIAGATVDSKCHLTDIPNQVQHVGKIIYPYINAARWASALVDAHCLWFPDVINRQRVKF